MQTMDMFTQQTIKEVGVSVRSFLEDLRPKTDWCQHLSGACAIGAYLTHKLLQYKDINSNIIIGKGDGDHCWIDIKLDNQVVVLDTTATQFKKDLAPVLLLPKIEYKKFEFYFDLDEERFIVNDTAFFNAVLTWPDDQRPETFKKEIYDSFGIVVG